MLVEYIEIRSGSSMRMKTIYGDFFDDGSE
jgi:hypothetical protein